MLSTRKPDINIYPNVKYNIRAYYNRYNIYILLLSRRRAYPVNIKITNKNEIKLIFNQYKV